MDIGGLTIRRRASRSTGTGALTAKRTQPSPEGPKTDPGTQATSDSAACKRRLRSVTTDAATLASFDSVVEGELAGDSEAFDDPPRLARWNDAMGDYIANAIRLNISFDFVFAGRGEPFMARGVTS